MTRKTSPGLQRALALYKDGMSGYDAARQAGVALSTVYRSDEYKALAAARQSAGSATQTRLHKIAQAMQLVRAGWSGKAAAEQCDLPEVTLYRSQAYKQHRAAQPVPRKERPARHVATTSVKPPSAGMRRALQLIVQGKSAYAAAHEAGVSRSAIYQSPHYAALREQRAARAPSPKLLQAMELVRGGTSAYAAADQAGIARSTLYASPLYREHRDRNKPRQRSAGSGPKKRS